MKLFIYPLAMLFLVGVAPAAWAGAAEEIAQTVQQRTHAFTEGNLDAWMAGYVDDAAVTASLIPFRIEGKDAIRTYYAGLFQTYPTRRVAFRQRAVRVYNGDTTGVTNAYLHVTLVDRNGQATALYLRQSVMWVKQDGRWLIADAHTSRLPVSP
jgi:uncharacterized protein (TIGR02246 family)